MSVSARQRLVVALTLVLVALVPVGQATRADAADTPTATTTSTAHPYGDPVWFPLRSAATIGCAKSDCGSTRGHGYWAIDFLGRRGQGIYAAGAGVAHIGGNSGTCQKTESEGRWVWIDHGAGVVSRYHHLNSITIKDGRLVTPATQIGTMGSSGDIAPCTTAYLHFEVRHLGVKGTRVDPGSLRACTADGPAALPQLYGVSSWDDPSLHTAPRRATPEVSSDCITPTWLATPAVPRVAVRRTSHRVTVWTPGLGGDATTWMVRLETYHPSTKAWGSPVYRLVPASTHTTVFGVDDTHAYRVYVSAHDGNGWSATSRALAAVGPPLAPRAPRYLSWPAKSYVRYGWYRPNGLGTAVTAFDVARACSTSSSGTLGAWKTYRQGSKTTYRNLRGLSAYRTCQVKVRAVSAAGAGAWSKVSTVRR